MQVFTPYLADPAAVFQRVGRAPILASALVVVDTNVLLAPYRSSSEALEAIIQAYQRLKEEGRLFVPGQVAREFAKNKPVLLTQLHKAVQDARAVSINGKLEALPILSAITEYQAALNELRDANQSIKKFRDLIDKLEIKIASWQHDDPVLQAYRSFLDSSVIRELQEPRENLQNLKKARFDAGIPPGNKDVNKEDGGVGDVLIWLTILELGREHKKDLVFVTEEKKADWFHRVGEHRCVFLINVRVTLDGMSLRRYRKPGTFLPPLRSF